LADDLHFPLVKIHLQSNFNLFGRIRNGNLSYIYILSTVALLILFIAGFNAIILTTLKVAKRSKETGLKKIFGAGRMTLYTQSLLESLCFSILVILIGTIVAIMIMPRFYIMPGLAGLHYNLSFTIYFILCSILLIWLITGIYPATIISGADPLNALKGKAIKNFTHVRLRMFLISLQFAISIFVLTVTFWIMSQIIFLYSTELGFDPKNIVVVPSFFHFSPYNEEFEAMIEMKKSDFITGLQRVGNYVEDELTRRPEGNEFEPIYFRFAENQYIKDFIPF
jgi:putative ABC transport system permease protein